MQHGIYHNFLRLQNSFSDLVWQSLVSKGKIVSVEVQEDAAHHENLFIS